MGREKVSEGGRFMFEGMEIALKVRPNGDARE